MKFVCFKWLSYILEGLGLYLSVLSVKLNLIFLVRFSGLVFMIFEFRIEKLR